MQITTYSSIKAWPEKRWLASLDIGKGLLMSFFRATEAEAIQAAQSWYDGELERQKRLEASTVNSMALGDGREATAGKIWMLNRTTDHRIRIDANELKLFEGRGYVRGGPRSK